MYLRLFNRKKLITIWLINIIFLIIRHERKWTALKKYEYIYRFKRSYRASSMSKIKIPSYQILMQNKIGESKTKLPFPIHWRSCHRIVNDRESHKNLHFLPRWIIQDCIHIRPWNNKPGVLSINFSGFYYFWFKSQDDKERKILLESRDVRSELSSVIERFSLIILISTVSDTCIVWDLVHFGSFENADYECIKR